MRHGLHLQRFVELQERVVLTMRFVWSLHTSKVWYGDFHFIDWQPAEVTQTCLMSQGDRLTKCKTFLDAPGPV